MSPHSKKHKKKKKNTNTNKHFNDILDYIILI